MAATSARVAKNIIKKYGEDKFRQLLSMLQDNRPGPEIANVFDVTRQRVNQWKNTLGIEHVSYTVHPEVLEVIPE